VIWAAGVLLLSARVASAQGWWPPKPLPGYNLFNAQREIWLEEIFAEMDDADAGIVKDAEANAYLQAKTWSRWPTWGIGVEKVGDWEDIRKKVKQLQEDLSRTGFQQAADLFFGITGGDELWADKCGIWSMYAAGYDP
jgi:hypothetical protein